MEFVCNVMCELPFMLNLPEDTYTVSWDSNQMELEVLQEHLAFSIDSEHFHIDSAANLQAKFGDQFLTGHRQQLRTVVRHKTRTEFTDENLPSVSDERLVDQIKTDLIMSVRGAYPGGKPRLDADSHQTFDSLGEIEKEALSNRCARIDGSKHLPRVDDFLLALNSLIRLYMGQFGDIFVEEVTLHHLAGAAPLCGVYVIISDGEQLLHQYGHAGKVPPLMRRQWLRHEDERVAQFTEALENGERPDSAKILEVRAMAFLERGATRSAIVEASAALDLSITRKLRDGYLRQGKTESEVDRLLSETIRFRDRTNKLMEEATGQRVSSIANQLYQTVLTNRHDYRNGIAHADVEPSLVDATAAVKSFLELTRVVREITV